MAPPLRPQKRKSPAVPGDPDDRMLTDSPAAAASPLATPSKRPRWSLAQMSPVAAAAAASPPPALPPRRQTAAPSSSSSSSLWNSPRAAAASAATASAASLALVSDDTRLADMLASLERQQLLDLLANLMAAFPQARPTVAALLPRPTLDSVAASLASHERRLHEAFPYSRFGSDRSDYAFNRVRPHLDAIRDVILQYIDFFVLPSSYSPALHHEYPEGAFGYLHLATTAVHALPVWQNDQHNADSRNSLYDRLGKYWRFAVAEVGRRARDEGKVFGTYIVGEWAQKLTLHATHVNGNHGFGEAYDEFKRLLGWIIGLDAGSHNPFGPSTPSSRHPSGQQPLDHQQLDLQQLQQQQQQPPQQDLFGRPHSPSPPGLSSRFLPQGMMAGHAPDPFSVTNRPIV